MSAERPRKSATPRPTVRQVRGSRTAPSARGTSAPRQRPARNDTANAGDALALRSALPPRGTRLPRAEREQFILREAVKFFAEFGFGGDTRELARRAHITHALLFRYFASKEALIERVYQEVYVGRWNPQWEVLIKDRTIPLRERITQFYRLYAQTILTYEWVRLILFAGLKGSDLNRDFFARVTDRIIRPICEEIRRHYRLPDVTRVPVTRAEIELVWGVNARIFYFGVRKYIYGMEVPRDIDAHIEAEVGTFFSGIGHTLKQLIQPNTARTQRGDPR